MDWKCTGSSAKRQNAGYHSDPTGNFWEKKKSWNGEWKKDNLRARPTIGKHSTGTSESEIPYQVFKIGKSIFSLSLGPCQSFERHQKLVNLFIFLFFS